METTLILFSGLAGTGKSTLANALGRELKIPIISFDYFIDYALPRHVMTEPGNWTNQDVFEMMNKLAGQQPFKKFLAPSLADGARECAEHAKPVQPAVCRRPVLFR